MAGQRQPIELLQAKGKKHLTKAEIEERMKTEVHAAADKVTPPKYLTESQKKTFRKIVKELRAIDLVTNLDVDALSRFVITQEQYNEVTEQLRHTDLMVDFEGMSIVNPAYEKLTVLQDRFFKQCRQGAADFGLTVSSRCRLVVPKAKEQAPKENKFSKFA